ncbi:N-term half of cowpox A-type inclusion protein [Murmansk poxvirus]|uniref:N-term half of cowpox A-type inclusion protein n=1 Tax=Murmansk poxvirus TaxID=2025359 RepID=A0A223FMW5_9POXV|nr:N-term half of cowpox A-type inclusion protein [Murmansk poxvirus]AST09336.1 N-term half of cowpox A-type inclusion protein [Murmansk poxvirus]
MEVENLIGKCRKHANDFAKEVESRWDEELTEFAGLYRKTRNIIRNILRDITVSISNDDQKKECYDIFLTTKLNDTTIDEEYRKLFGDGSDIESRVNSVGKYTLFLVMTYVTATSQLGTSTEVINLLTKLFNIICDIHDKYLCSNMFIGIPASLITILDIDDINGIYTNFNQRYAKNVGVYDEFFLFITMNHYMQPNNEYITISYGPVSFTSSISIPDFIMEALTFKSCDDFYKSENLNYVYIFTRKIGVLDDGTDEVYQYVRLVEMFHNGVTKDSDDYDDCSAVLNLDINRHIDRFRNRLILLTPELIPLRKNGNHEDAEPDYRYLVDEEVKNEVEDDLLDIDDVPETKDDDVPKQSINAPVKGSPIKGTLITGNDYQIVINKLIEWLDKCDGGFNYENDDDSNNDTNDLETAKKKIRELLDNIKNLEKDSNDYKEKVKKLEKELEEKLDTIKRLTKEIQDLRNGGSNNGDNKDCLEKVKKLEKELEEKLDTIKRLTKEIQDLRNGGSNNGDNKDCLEKVKKLEKELEEKLDTIKRLTKEIQDLRNGGSNGNNNGDCDCNALNKRINDLDDLLKKEKKFRDELTEELDKVRNGKIEGSCARELDLFRRWLKDRDDDLQNEINKRRELERELHRLRKDNSECDKYKDELDKARKNIDSMKDDLDKHKKDLDSEKQKNKDLQSRLDKCVNDQNQGGAENQAKIRDLEDKLEKCKKDKDTEIKHYKDKITEVQRKLDDCMASGDGTSSEIDRLKKKIDELTLKLNECRNDNSANKDNEKLRERIKDLERKLNECISNETGNKDNHLKIIERQRDQIKDLEKALDRWSKEETDKYNAYKSEIERLRTMIKDLQDALDKERSSDRKDDSYYRRELTRERAKIVELERELNKCFDDNYSKYIDELEKSRRQIFDLERQLRECKMDSVEYNKERVKILESELRRCKSRLDACNSGGGGGSNHNHDSNCSYYDEDARNEIRRLRDEIRKLHDELKRERESDKNDSYYRRELERQREKVIMLEKELAKYFDDKRLEQCKREAAEFLKKIKDLEEKLNNCNRDHDHRPTPTPNPNPNGGGGHCIPPPNCEFERKKINELEEELKKYKHMVKALEKFMEFDRLQRECNTKLEQEKEKRIKLENDLERERDRREIGGNKCEKELEMERANSKKLEVQLDLEREKVRFYKREIEKDRYLSKFIKLGETNKED